jgi:hypothetical protein
VARDRVGDIGAVTRIQSSSARHFFAITTVYVKRAGRWGEDFENGELRPRASNATKLGLWRNRRVGLQVLR